MKTITLGRTSLEVSVFGLGAGGHSRLGLSYGKTPEHAADLVRFALDQGINFIDSAEVYGTEEAVGSGIKGRRREDVVLCTKLAPRHQKQIKAERDIEQSLAGSLKRLGTDYLDVYLVHGVSADDYDIVERDFYPILRRFQEKGLVRFIGLTEAFGPDRAHAMLAKAVRCSHWDVLMVGFNYLNHSARNAVLPAARDKDIGILDMFVVRHALINQQRLQPILARLVQQGIVARDAIDLARPLQFLFDDAGVVDFAEAGYRFCLAEPLVHIVLSGTGSQEHLRQNIAAINKGPLDAKSVERLRTIFRSVCTENGDGT